MKHGESWTNVFYCSLYLKVNLDLANQLGDSSSNFIVFFIFFLAGESLPNCLERDENWFWILTQKFWWKGEHTWRLEEGVFKKPFDGYICHVKTIVVYYLLLIAKWSALSAAYSKIHCKIYCCKQNVLCYLLLIAKCNVLWESTASSKMCCAIYCW